MVRWPGWIYRTVAMHSPHSMVSIEFAVKTDREIHVRIACPKWLHRIAPPFMQIVLSQSSWCWLNRSISLSPASSFHTANVTPGFRIRIEKPQYAIRISPIRLLETTMAAEPESFRDQFVSLFQSAVDQVVRSTTPAATLASRPGTDNALVNAAATIASLKSQGASPLPDVAPDEVAQDAWTCAKMGFALMEARARGDATGAESIENDLRFNV